MTSDDRGQLDEVGMLMAHSEHANLDAIGVINMVTGEAEFHPHGWLPSTDAEAEQYIPQGNGVRLYRNLRHEGVTIADAMLRVLQIATGIARNE